MAYKRVLIKISGEALAGEKGFGLDSSVLNVVASQIKKVVDSKIEVGLVIGGGNFWRGKQHDSTMDRSAADHMGMLATIMNAIAMQDALEAIGVVTRVQTALTITEVAEPYIYRKALRHFEKGRVVIFGAGTGNPFFSTDTAAALKAAEIHADVLLLAKNIDGVYSADPKVDASAKKYDEISYKEVINQNLKAMDTTAITMCMDNNIPIVAFGLKEEDGINRAAKGEAIGTLIH